MAIVNKGNNTGDLSARDVLMIYEGKKKSWDNGEAINLLLPPSNSESMKILTEKIFKFSSEADVSKFYLKAVFQQKFATPPKSVTSANDAVTEIVVSPGAIAIVDAAEVSDKSKVKILKISGR